MNILDNFASSTAGGVILHNVDLVVENSLFDNNESNRSTSGAIGSFGNGSSAIVASVHLKKSTFTNNRSRQTGGVINSRAMGVTIEDNEAVSGGGLFAEDATGQICRDSYIGNAPDDVVAAGTTSLLDVCND